MSALTINGVDLPVSADGWSEALVEVGQRSRSASGKALQTTQRRYRKWTGSLLLTDAELAEAMLGLLNADGIGWSFDASLFADGKGLGAVTTGTTPTIVASDGGVSPKYGAAMLKAPASSTAVWTHGIGCAKYSVAVWAYVSGAWHHYAKRSDYGSGYWTDGVYGAGSTSIFAASSTTVSLAAGAGATQLYDDLLFFPFLLPTTWIAALAASATAYPKPPTLTAGGDLFAYGSTSVRGEAARADYTNRGALAAMQKISVALEED